MNLFQIIFTPFCACMTLLVIMRTAQGKISHRHGLLWIILWLTGTALIVNPGISLRVANWLGIGRGSDLVFYLAIICGMLACLYFHNRNRSLEILVTQLVRREAIEHADFGEQS